jgi:hypothetical protein
MWHSQVSCFNDHSHLKTVRHAIEDAVTVTTVQHIANACYTTTAHFTTAHFTTAHFATALTQ